MFEYLIHQIGTLFLLLLLVISLIVVNLWFVYVNLSMQVKEKYFTECTIRQLDTISNKLERVFTFICKIIIKVFNQCVSFIMSIISKNTTSINPLLCGTTSELEAIFEECFTDFKSFRYLAQQSYDSEYITDYVFKVVLINQAIKIEDLIRSVKNEVVKMLNTRFPLNAIDHDNFVAVKYDNALEVLHIYLAKSQEGFAEIYNLNNPLPDEEEPTEFEERFNDYGK